MGHPMRSKFWRNISNSLLDIVTLPIKCDSLIVDSSMAGFFATCNLALPPQAICDSSFPFLGWKGSTEVSGRILKVG